jgi:hypothetical protein
VGYFAWGCFHDSSAAAARFYGRVRPASIRRSVSQKTATNATAAPVP